MARPIRKAITEAEAGIQLGNTTGNVQRERDASDKRRMDVAPDIARQVREGRHRSADGDIHAVSRRITSSRNQEAAAATQVDRGPVRRWRRASALAALPSPAGFHLEYVRRDNTQRGDMQNLIEHIQEGWEFARRSDFPEHTLPTQRLTDHGEVIGNATTILMKIPEELYAQRCAYYNGRRDAITKAINRRKPGLDEANSKMPLVEDVNDYGSEFERTRVRRARRQVGVRAD